jgi:hypothetical protein
MQIRIDDPKARDALETAFRGGRLSDTAGR